VSIATSLAVSHTGQRAVCWTQSVAAVRYHPRARCAASRRGGGWTAPRRVLPQTAAAQYIPAAVFQGRRLWVATYVATPRRARIVLVRAARAGGRFGVTRTLGAWNVPVRAFCVVPDCAPA
jgi:hypothetical protein